MAAVAFACGFGFAGATIGKAIPASTITFDGGNCTAKFVRSASGIVNQTSLQRVRLPRECGRLHRYRRLG